MMSEDLYPYIREFHNRCSFTILGTDHQKEKGFLDVTVFSPDRQKVYAPDIRVAANGDIQLTFLIACSGIVFIKSASTSMPTLLRSLRSYTQPFSEADVIVIPASELHCMQQPFLVELVFLTPPMTIPLSQRQTCDSFTQTNQWEILPSGDMLVTLASVVSGRITVTEIDRAASHAPGPS